MDDQVTPDIIKATQVSLGKYVKRPPLSDKLLKKPPFRFLHDIITSVLKNTGFFKGLFQEEELISDNVKDRESKILFLNKVITVVASTTGKPLIGIKPSKIVAGQEPQRTNELLQYIALALDSKLSSDEAVKLYKESIKSNNLDENKSKDILTKPIKRVADVNKLTSKSNEKLIKNDKSSINIIKTRQKENVGIKKESSSKKTTQSSKSINKKGPDKEKQGPKSTIIIRNKINNSNDIEAAKKFENSIDSSANNLKLNQALDDNALSSSIVNNIENPKEETTVKDIDSCLFTNEEELESQEKPSEVAEKSVHKGIVKNDSCEGLETETVLHIKSGDIQKNEDKANVPQELHTIPDNNTNKVPNNDEIITPPQAERLTKEPRVGTVNEKRSPSVRPSSSRPSAPKIRDRHENIINPPDNLVGGKVNLIAENMTREEEEETSIIIINDKDASTESQDQGELLSSNKHGHLVQQILDAQKEFSEATGKTNIEWQFGAQKARDVLNQEIEQIRFNVQALSRIANPQGKLLDHIQEDVEIMRQELNQWTKSYEEASKKLLKEKAFNEESLLPLHIKLKQQEVDLTEKRDKINDVKIGIQKNATRIKKLLANGNVQVL